MIGAVCARLVFAIAASSTLLATMGLAAPPHQVAPGTPKQHALVLGAYSFAFLLDPSSKEAGVPLTPAMAALHKAMILAGIPIANMPGMDEPDSSTLRVIATTGLSPLQELVITLALLVALAPRLPRPTRRIIARLPFGLTSPAQWRPTLPLAPPRPIFLSLTAQ